ncbi:MAG: RNA polymerase factor sigma-54 [Armatimonadetes bacterium]|nr:RNA polymerase factor sigma-54 [Armatimonadota bacterium]
MNRGIGNTARTEVSTSLRVDPRVVLRSKLLELTQAELEQTIESELSDNPALERLDDDPDPITDDEVLASVAPQELAPSSEDFEFFRSLPRDDSIADWVDLAASSVSLSDHLRGQLIPALPEHLRNLGVFMIECLDDRGYFASTVEEVALLTGHEPEEATLVLKMIQDCDPKGIGASDVKECLYLQLRDSACVEGKLARIIVKKHLDEFVARRTSRLMRRYKVMPEVVESAFQMILSLNPFPAEGFESGTGMLRPVKEAAVVPELTLTRTEAGWIIEVMGAEPAAFAVDRSYRHRLAKLQQSSQADPAEKAHVTNYVRRAEQFIDAIADRRKTMRRIGEVLIRKQESFVSTGRYEFLKPLTRVKLAEELGLHESTISRATQGKYVRLANGETVPFDVFFKPSLRIQRMIEEILETENPRSPLSDEQIMRMLSQKGVTVARRTVNKYRGRSRMLNSRVRRTA